VSHAYKLYDPNRPCSKCGGTSVGTHYFGSFMERRCARCGYKWTERPLDMRTPEDGPSPTKADAYEEASASGKGLGREGIGIFHMNPRD
jgi:hypothetical protein